MSDVSDAPAGFELNTAGFRAISARLERCPFCGGLVELMGVSRTQFGDSKARVLWYSFGVRCTQCPISTGLAFLDPDTAVAFWNSRHAVKAKAQPKKKAPDKEKAPPKKKPAPVAFEVDDSEETLPLFSEVEE